MCAVSYLNTVPLVWGMLHGPQLHLFDLTFAVPSACANQVENDVTDIGIVPVVECARLGLEVIPGTGIACRGPVRSILLISRTPFTQIRRLATDSGSRTSVQLARIILQQRYDAEPELISMEPDPTRMLAAADACLLIGDAALRVDPAAVAERVLDLGAEWAALTGLPMVFAVWAGRPAIIQPWMPEAFHGSLRHGQTNINTIVEMESRNRGLRQDLVRSYLCRHIQFEIGTEEEAGMRQFLQFAAELDRPVRPEAIAL